MPQQRYVIGHVAWTPALSPMLADLYYHHLFIIRDPRAVVVSLMAFILDTGGMPHPHFLRADFALMSPKQRLDFILAGGNAPQAGVAVKGFAEVYRTMLAWRNDPTCLVVRFEDLVGYHGGGSAERQQAVIRRIAAHLDLPFNETIADHIDTIYSPTARTYRIGRIDGWKESLDAENLARLTAFCKPLCLEAGYEV